MITTLARLAGIWLTLSWHQASPSLSTQVSEADILAHLPAHARLERPVVRAGLSRTAEPEAVVFYSAPTGTQGAIVTASSHVVVFQQLNNELKKLWTLDCNGAYAGFSPDTGVYDINKTGPPKIVVDCEGTTVCPNFFGIFEYKDGKIVPVPSEFRPLETCRVEVKDLDGDGIPEIINYPRAYGTLPQIFRWDGNKYAQADRHFPEYWLDYGNRNFGPLNPSQNLPLYVVVDHCTLAAKVFSLARSAERARPVCRQARRSVATGRAILESSSPQYPALSKEALRKIDDAVTGLKTEDTSGGGL